MLASYTPHRCNRVCVRICVRILNSRHNSHSQQLTMRDVLCSLPLFLPFLRFAFSSRWFFLRSCFPAQLFLLLLSSFFVPPFSVHHSIAFPSYTAVERLSLYMDDSFSWKNTTRTSFFILFIFRCCFENR